MWYFKEFDFWDQLFVESLKKCFSQDIEELALAIWKLSVSFGFYLIQFHMYTIQFELPKLI